VIISSERARENRHLRKKKRKEDLNSAGCVTHRVKKVKAV